MIYQSRVLPAGIEENRDRPATESYVADILCIVGVVDGYGDISDR